LNSLGTKRSTGETKRNTKLPTGRLEKNLLPEKTIRKKEKPAKNNTKLQSPEDSENKISQPYNWEKTIIPMVYTMEETKNSTREGRHRSLPSRRSYLLGCFQKKRTQETPTGEDFKMS